jgi:hypothetical protein
MPTSPALHALCATLETDRLKAVEAMAAGGAPSREALRELATLQAALTAVRESIEEADRPTGDEEELENAALGLIRTE